MENQYTRTVAVLGDDAIKKLNNSHVAVFGVGGVGHLGVHPALVSKSHNSIV